MTTATQIQVPVGDVALDGDLVIPDTAKGIVLFSTRRVPSSLSSRRARGSRGELPETYPWAV